MNNKKGFTLVELLAVIVILALIMSIAVVSIGGILNSTRESTFKETAVSIINGVKQKLILANRLEVGDYEFTSDLLEKGGTDSPLGGTIQFRSSMSDCAIENMIGNNVCKVSYKTCSSAARSFVRVTRNGDVFTYSICLTAGENEKYIDLVSEDTLLDSNNNGMIKESGSASTFFNPAAPTISGGTSNVYNYQATNLTCTTNTTYEAGTNIYYEFGYATTANNWTAGSITWLGNPSISTFFSNIEAGTNLSVAKDAYLGTRVYGCRVYVSDGSSSSEKIVSTGSTSLSLVYAKIDFRPPGGTSSGITISGQTSLYAPYGGGVLYIGSATSTRGTPPKATKSGYTFTGWWTAGGKKVIAPGGGIQANVPGWTNEKGQFILTKTTNNTLYAAFSH